MQIKVKSLSLKVLFAILIFGSFFTVGDYDYCFANDYEVEAQTLVQEDSNKSSNAISIAMASDNNYVLPTVVSMTSVMKNSAQDFRYDFYVMHPPSLSKKSKQSLKSLEYKYKNCTVNLIDMGDSCKLARTDPRIPTSAYYRLMIQDLLPNVDTVIWLDGDTIVLGNLVDMFSINMEGFCYKGFLDYLDLERELHTFRIHSNNYICSGVMLINLKEMRSIDATKKTQQFIAKNNSKLRHHDQTVLNAVFADKIGALPAKFGIFNSLTWNMVKNWSKSKSYWRNYSSKEIVNAHLHPAIIHCIRKPWRRVQVPSTGIWWKYADQSGFINEIREKYSVMDGVYMIVSALDSGRVLDVSGASTATGTKLQLWEKNNSSAQKFKITYDKNGCYRIKAMCSGKYIDVPYASQKEGERLWQYDGNNTDAQKWYIFRSSNGECQFVSKCNSMAIDVKNADTKMGTTIQCWSVNGTKAQKFRLIKVG